MKDTGTRTERRHPTTGCQPSERQRGGAVAGGCATSRRSAGRRRRLSSRGIGRIEQNDRSNGGRGDELHSPAPRSSARHIHIQEPWTPAESGVVPCDDTADAPWCAWCVAAPSTAAPLAAVSVVALRCGHDAGTSAGVAARVAPPSTPSSAGNLPPCSCGSHTESYGFSGGSVNCKAITDRHRWLNVASDSIV